MQHDDVAVACGSGVVDFSVIFEAISPVRRNKLLFILDQDPSDTDMLADHATSIRYLNGLIG